MDCRLKRCREKRGWTQTELAKRAGVSWETIAELESGERCVVSSEELLKLALTLGATVEALFF